MGTTKLRAGDEFPKMTVKKLGGGDIQLGTPQNDATWHMVVVYRGKHCPLCTKYLAQLKELKATYKDDREAQARAMMEIYRDAGMNPFASILLILIQIPVVIALYFSVYSGGGIALPEINTALLYSWVMEPAVVTMNFLGMFDITQRSIMLAVAAAVTQYIVVHLTMPKLAPKEADAAPDLKADFARNMQLQMRYVMPILIGVVAYSISAAIALYFLVSNITAIGQEYFVRKHR